ncbi:MAG: SpoIIE family protein phosphatase [Bacillota bacterium]
MKSLKIPELHLDRDPYYVTALGLLLARTVLAGSLAPFAPAFYAGLRRQNPRLSLYAALGSAIGAATMRDWSLLAYNVLAFVLVTLAMRVGRDRKAPGILDSLLSGGVVTVSRLVAAAVNSPSLFSYMSALLEGLCAVVVAALTQIAFSPDRDKGPSFTEKASEALLVVVLLSLGGLHGLTVYGIGVLDAAAMGCTLVAGFAAGPGGGAIAGLAAGLIVALTGSDGAAILGVLGVSGLLAGVGGWFGRVESVLGYLSGGLLMSIYAESSGDLTIRLTEQFISCVAILLLTKRSEKMLSERFPVLAAGRNASRPRPAMDAHSVRTAAVAHALLEMGDMLSQAASASTVAISDTADEDLATDPSVVRLIAERVCRDCEDRSSCWEERFGETYEAFLDLTRSMQVSGQITSESNSRAADLCRRFPQVIGELNHVRELSRLERRLRTIDDETKDCLSFQYRCLGQLLAPRPQPAAEAAGRVRKQRLKVTVKGGSTPAEGTDRPGDMWVKYDISPTRTLAVLVDGMGKGESAAKQSKETIEILRSLLDCGLDYDSCVSFLNSALFLSCRPDSFVAVDCLLIDQDTERAYFHKLGAPPSFIRKKDGNVLVVRGSRPPAGAFSALPCFATSEPVAAGDEIYLVSDGIFRSSPVPARAEHLLISRLRRLKEGSLDLSVKTLLGYGRRVGGQEPPDDVTVVAARIERV